MIHRLIRFRTHIWVKIKSMIHSYFFSYFYCPPGFGLSFVTLPYVLNFGRQTLNIITTNEQTYDCHDCELVHRPWLAPSIHAHGLAASHRLQVQLTWLQIATTIIVTSLWSDWKSWSRLKHNILYFFLNLFIHLFFHNKQNLRVLFLSRMENIERENKILNKNGL